MKKGLLLYRSKYGATKKYVRMLEEELSCDVCDTKSGKGYRPEAYDWIIFAGGIYASGIAGLDILRKNYPLLKGKKLAVLCVGASPYDEKALEEIRARNLKGELQEIPVFYGRGAWDESSMTWKDRMLCGMLQKMVAKKDPASCEPWMKALLSAVGQKCDWTDKTYVMPLVEYIKNLSGFDDKENRL